MRVYAVERTTVAVLAQVLAAADGAAEIVQVIHGGVMDIELPGRVDVIVSKWLGGFGITKGCSLLHRRPGTWLKPCEAMIPRPVTAWTARVNGRY